MEQESTDSELAPAAGPLCPIESRLDGLGLLVAALLIFLALHCLLAVFERHNTQPRRRRSIKRHVERNTSPTLRTDIQQQSRGRQRSRALQVPRPSTVRSRSSGNNKTVRFAEAPSVQCIQPFYEPADFYDEPYYFYRARADHTGPAVHSTVLVGGVEDGDSEGHSEAVVSSALVCSC